MILPISKSFQSLKTRLECINFATFELPLAPNHKVHRFFGEDYNMEGSDLTLEECLNCFDERLVLLQEYFRQREKVME